MFFVNLWIRFISNLICSMKIIQPKAIIFDWDNTLVDTWPLISKAINETMEKMHRPKWSMDYIKKNVHKSMRESFPDIFGHEWEKAGEIYKNTYRSLNLSELEFLPNALEVVDFLNSKHIKCFVVSNKIGNTLRREAENFKINTKFLKFVGAGDAKFDKPNPEPVYLALENSDINLKEDLVWFMGDTITDIDCAINSNCQPILYGEGLNVDSKTIEHLKSKKEKPLLHFLDHSQFLDFLITVL